MSTQYYSPESAAEFFGLSKKTVLRAIRTGELPSIRYNKRVFRILAIDASCWYAGHGGRLKKSASLSTSGASGLTLAE
jgi:excisionase family DNA binding protein